MRVLEDGRRAAGEHVLRVNTRDLAQGTYFVRLRTDDAALSRKISVVD